MAESVSPSPSLAAGSSAALGASVVVCLSAPALARPLVPAILFVWVLPLVLGFLLAALFGWLPGLKRAPRLVAVVGGLLAAVPWLAVGAAPMSRWPLAAGVAALAVCALAWFSVGRYKGVLVALVAGLILLLLPRSTRLELEGERSLIVLGFDAATWDQIDPLIESGQAPAFARLRREAATGILHSEEPSASPRVWTTIASGVSPELHNILSFGSPRQELAAGRIWNEVLDQGGSAGVVGWLVNWPPEPGLAFSTPAWTDGGDVAIPAGAGFVKGMDLLRHNGVSLLDPRMLKHGLSAFAVSSAADAWLLVRDAVRLLRGLDEEREDHLMRMLRARLKASTFLELLDRDRPCFSALVTYPTDQLGHKYWQYHEPELFPSLTPEQREGMVDYVLDSYLEADRVLGLVLDRIDPARTAVVVVSDHGMEALPESSAEGKVVKVREQVVTALGLQDRLVVDFLNSRMILTPREKGPGGRDALVQAEQRFSAIRYAGREESPWVVDLDLGKGFVSVLPQDGVEDNTDLVAIGGQEVPAAGLFFVHKETGRHHLRGIWAYFGPGAAAGSRVEGAGLRDVAPTVLYALGLAVPEEIEGRVLEQCWSAEWLAAHPVLRKPGGMAPPPEVAEIAEDEDAKQANLQELGYAGEDD